MQNLLHLTPLPKLTTRTRISGLPNLVSRVFFITLAIAGAQPQIAAHGSSRKGTTVEWDENTLTLVARNAGYARMIRLGNDDILCVGDQGGTIWTKRSADEGRSWINPVRVASYPFGVATNPELLQLENRWILCCYNERPTDKVHPFAIMTSISKDEGKTWSPGQRIYSADKEWDNGCWEPAAIQLPNGEIQVFFANENPYRSSGEQEITMLRSKTKGRSWSKPTRVSFRSGHRDGMPVPLVLNGRKGIVVAIEDNGLKGQFKPAILYSTLKTNWRKGTIGGRDPRRWSALKKPLDPSVTAAAPYIRQMPSGETILSLQSDEGGGKPHMVVYVGDNRARNFANPSIPFPVGKNTSCLWNSLFVKSSEVITAVSGTRIKGVPGIWAIDGRLVKKGD